MGSNQRSKWTRCCTIKKQHAAMLRQPEAAAVKKLYREGRFWYNRGL
ncbi:MAG: hypothetical protein LBD24_07540 [Spirochaetaceae bacterium]|nr:hypothetical protein [Spirochaetaceae bacterium]